MHKSFKKVLALTLALMLMVGMLGILPAAADEVSYEAALGYANSDWSAQSGFGVDSTVKTTVTGPGTYTLSWDAAASDALVFCIDIIGAAAAGNEYDVTALTITADGVDVPVDVTKLATGDLEQNGNFRIEIYNEYGSTKADAPVDPAAVSFATNLTVTFTIAEAGVYTANLGFADTAWGAQEWGENANTTVSGAGSYTVSWDIPEGGTAAIDAGVFVVDLVGAQAAMTAENKTFNVTALTVTADGVDIPVDVTKIATGDIEENGNYRIEIYNQYGSTAETLPIDPAAVVFASNLTVSFTLEEVDAGEPTEPTEPEVVVPEIDLNGTYNAYLGLQTPNWTYRDGWNTANGIGSEYWGDFIYGNETSQKYGKVTDAVITGNGTYTVSVTDFGTVFADDFATAGQDWFNLLYISTDIPLSDSITVSDVKLIIDGKTIQTYSEAYLDPDVSDYVKILIQNIWNADVAELNYYAAPSKSLEMQFTISGFAYDNEAQATEPQETEPQATEPTDTTEPEGGNNILPIIIAVVAVVAIAVVVVVVLKNKKKA